MVSKENIRGLLLNGITVSGLFVNREADYRRTQSPGLGWTTKRPAFFHKGNPL